MKRDTRPEIPRTRLIDIPADPPTMEKMRGDALRDRLVLDADMLATTFDRPIGAALMRGIAASLGDDIIVTDSPFEQAAYIWGLIEDADNDPRGCASLLIAAAAATLRCEPLLCDMLAGIAAAIDGQPPPSDASNAWRMGHKAVQECLSKRPTHTVKSKTAPPLLETPVPPPPPLSPPPPVDEGAVTRPHAAASTGPQAALEPEPEPMPPPMLDPVFAQPRDPDAPVPRGKGAVREDALTRLHQARTRTEPIRRR